VLCLGDVYDVATRDSKTPPVDQAMLLGDAIKYAREWFGRLAKAGLLDTIVRGNHPERLYNYAGIHLEDDLCETLGVKPLGFSGVVAYECGKGDQEGTRSTFTVYAHHTIQGGRTAGAALNACAGLMSIVQGCDYYVAGHSHQLVTKPVDRYTPNVRQSHRAKNMIVRHSRWLVCSGSFLEWDLSYAEAHGYQPSPPGYVILHLDRRDLIHKRSGAETFSLTG
jgi:hypothetical protein